ncbi:MAG: LytTR family transcriptional regulator DNA-binding domain-containing protein [Lachnospiraceae bacterium]|nr:LytTR family transcriptional regulator DNA-binding domain-containing protein [Lachnospiraceae bacterium]
MEVEIVHSRQDGIGVTIDCPKVDKTVERLKTHIEQFDSRIKGNCNGEICFVDIKDIYYFDTVDNRTFLYTENQCVEVAFRLYELEEMLTEKDFIRISKSQIVNIQRMKSLMPQMNRTLLITMNNEERLCISRRYVKSMKDKLGL